MIGVFVRMCCVMWCLVSVEYSLDELRVAVSQGIEVR